MKICMGVIICLPQKVLATLILISLLGALLACGSNAPDVPEIRVEGVWSRPAMAMEHEMEKETEDSTDHGMSHGMGGTGAVYMKLVNEGREADRLVGAQTDVAEVAEIHETKVENDVMKMQLLPNGLEIPAEGEVELKPGGYHVMLIGLKQDLKEGDELSLVLEFEKSAKMTVQAMVRQP
jgi:copper(I)-binding protein